MADNFDASEAAKELGRRGGLKGGKARSEALTPERRAEIGQKAIAARWAKARGLTPADIEKLPRATHKGELKIGGGIECFVLEDGRRIIHQRGMVKGLGMSRGSSSVSGGDRLAKFAQGKALKPYMEGKLDAVTHPFLFLTDRGMVAYGYEATALADLCEAIIDADRAGVLQEQQQHIAKQAHVLYRGFARVGITALVDEATGYEKDKAKDDLHRILELYVAKELLPWSKRFPDEFYQQLFRLKGWEYPPRSSKRPKIIGKLTEQLVYKRLPPGVLEEIREKNPVTYKGGSRKARHHQLLTDEIGNPHLEKQVLAVTTILRISRDWHEFVELFERSDPNARHQARLQLTRDDEE
jgi:hypothetical protein